MKVTEYTYICVSKKVYHLCRQQHWQLPYLATCYFCQILFHLVYSWESYHKNKKGEQFFLRHSVVKTRQHSTFIYYSFFRFTYFPTIATAGITINNAEQGSLRVSFVSKKQRNTQVSSQSAADITHAVQSRKTLRHQTKNLKDIQRCPQCSYTFGISSRNVTLYFGSYCSSRLIFITNLDLSPDKGKGSTIHEVERRAWSRSRFLGSQPAGDWVVNTAVGGRYFLSGPLLTSQTTKKIEVQKW